MMTSTTPNTSFVHVTSDNGSPLAAGLKRGNLTGTPRKAKDSSAELYNFIQEWNKSHITGMDILYEMMEMKLGNEASAESNLFSRKLQEVCNRLEVICLKLTETVRKLKIVVNNFEGLKKLEEHRGNSLRPLFNTWTTEEYVSLAKNVYESYEKELKIKLSVKKNIAHCSRREEMMLYCALWAHEPYIDESVTTYLDMMLRDAGHR